MTDINELRACMARRGKTQEDCARAIGKTSRCFTHRMQTGIFTSDEIEKLVEYLEIDSPQRVFFPNW